MLNNNKVVNNVDICRCPFIIVNFIVSPYTLSSEWIAMTNTRVFHNAIIKFYNNEMYTCLLLRLPANGLL